MSTKEHATPVVSKAYKETFLELLEPEKTEPINTDREGFLYKFIMDRANTKILFLKGHVWKLNLPPEERKKQGLPTIEESEAKLKEYLGRYPKITTDTELYVHTFIWLQTLNLLDALYNNKTFRRTFYRKAYEGLKEEYTGKDYSDLLTEIYENNKPLNEIFVRLVEEQEKVAITSAKQLQELTGIDRINEDELSDKDARAEARSQMKDTFIKAMKYRYAMALEKLLDGGGKYSDLLKTDPAKYHLKDSDKKDAIQEAIYYSFELGDAPDMKKNLQDTANSIKAPYETVLLSSQRHNTDYLYRKLKTA